MAEGCGPSCGRVLLIIFNILFWLSGCGLLALGIFLLVNEEFSINIAYLDVIAEAIPETSTSLLTICAYALIAVGAFVIIIGFLGCCGAIKENKCMLGMYIFFLVIILLAEGGIGGVGVYFKEDIIDEVDSKFKELVDAKYASDGNFNEVINNVQIELKCCGWSSATDDYAGVTYDGVTGTVPSCCVFDSSLWTGDYLNMTYAGIDAVDAGKGTACIADTDGSAGARITTSCKDTMVDWINENSIILIGVAIGIACLELFGIIFACCLCRNVSNDD